MMLALVLAAALAGTPAAALAAAKPPAKKQTNQAQKGSRPKADPQRKKCVATYVSCRSRCDSARGVRALATCKQKNNCFSKYMTCRGGRT